MEKQRRRAVRSRRKRRRGNKGIAFLIAAAIIGSSAAVSIVSTASTERKLVGLETGSENPRPTLIIIHTEKETKEGTESQGIQGIQGIQGSEGSEEDEQEGRKNEDAYILAKMAMAEAEGEDTEGKALVILVILNRLKAENFPDTVSQIVSQKNAFTSYRNGRYDRSEPDEDCWEALNLVASGWDKSQGALYFERTPGQGESTWHSENLEKLFSHGNHTFYGERG